jgi:hypothetical protein
MDGSGADINTRTKTRFFAWSTASHAPGAELAGKSGRQMEAPTLNKRCESFQTIVTMRYTAREQLPCLLTVAGEACAPGA